MIATVVVAVLLISAATSANIVPKLSNGEDALIAELPFVVSIQEINVHICVGSLLSERWILSAARCFVTRNIPDLNIEYGNTVISPGPVGDNKAAIAEIIYHEDYSASPLLNDVAVVLSATPIITGLFDPFVKLAAPGARIRSGIPSVHAGWGHTSLGVRGTTLQKAFVGIISHAECEIAAGETQGPSRNQICGYGESLICTGDLGSPLLVNGVQVGIASFRNGQNCINVEGQFPNFYTDVSFFVDWIEDNTGIDYQLNVFLQRSV